ncbi:MAG: BtpA/SgcQ family protein [Phycisphaerae bacterium]
MIHLPSQALIGVIHLPPLPGSPQHQFPMEDILERALTDAHALKHAGFDGAIIENYGDAPFMPESVPRVTVSCMSVIADAVRNTTGLRIGINVLRNDAESALAVAVASAIAITRGVAVPS